LHEEEPHTAPALRLAAPPAAVHLGKCAFNLALLLLLEVLVVPLFIVMMGLQVAARACSRWCCWATWAGWRDHEIAAMVPQASTRGLFTVLPSRCPAALISAIADTATLLQAAAAACLLQVLHHAAMVTVALMLFPVIWAE
jgi:heme exporter protein B